MTEQPLGNLSGHQLDPPADYYVQPPRHGRQGPSLREHMNALEDRREAEIGERPTASMTTMLDAQGDAVHEIHLKHPSDGSSRLTWHGSPATFPGYREGEIHMVRSSQPGDARAMHDTARAMAMSDPNISFPKHSGIRTDEGVEWVYREQVRHGEQTWGVPPVNHPDRPAYDRWMQGIYDEVTARLQGTHTPDQLTQTPWPEAS